MSDNPTSFTQKDFEITQRELLYKGYFSLEFLHIKHRLFSGGWSDVLPREIVTRSPAAALIPYDPRLDRIILVEQFRMGALNDAVSPWQIEIPAGLLGANETPKDVAIRETKEEAGCDVTNIQLIYDYYVSPGASNEYIHVFYGEVDASHIEGLHGLQEEHEDIRVLNLPAEEALAKLHRQEIKNGPTIVALQWFELHHARLRA